MKKIIVIFINILLVLPIFAQNNAGKMDDEAYLTRTLAKLNIYAKNGFTLGKNLIATFESSTSALNRTTLIRTIENALN